MKENDDNESQIYQENGQTSENSSTSTNFQSLQSNNNNTKKKNSKNECMKINMNQYMKKYKNQSDSNNNRTQKMKQNKEQEKDEVISGEKEININELNIFDSKNNEELQQNLAFISYLKKDFYKALYRIQIFCDFR